MFRFTLWSLKKICRCLKDCPREELPSLRADLCAQALEATEEGRIARHLITRIDKLLAQ